MYTACYSAEELQNFADYMCNVKLDTCRIYSQLWKVLFLFFKSEPCIPTPDKYWKCLLKYSFFSCMIGVSWYRHTECGTLIKDKFPRKILWKVKRSPVMSRLCIRNVRTSYNDAEVLSLYWERRLFCPPSTHFPLAGLSGLHSQQFLSFELFSRYATTPN